MIHINIIYTIMTHYNVVLAELDAARRSEREERNARCPRRTNALALHHTELYRCVLHRALLPVCVTC